MANYRIELKRSAAKEIENVNDKEVRRKIVSRIARLAENPRPPGCEKLSGLEHYRIRQGPYRIVYSVYDHVLLVEVVKIRHRREVYR